MSAVTFDEVTKQFGDVTAVDELSLQISDGEFMVLLGPSGCGKSTALRMIAGLEEISGGILSIGERVVNHVPPRERDIAMVFQSYALYPHMSVAKNIESPLVANRSARVTPAERTRRVAEAADTLGLGDYLDRKPGELSGGQRQRVALARAIVRNPEVFLMDEPLSNLDAKLRTQTRLELVELHRRLGTTFVYVTHDQVEAMTMADRIAVINDGKLQQVGAPQAVYERPANLFVASFIGSPPMNTVAGTLVTDGAAPFVRTAAGPVLIAESARIAASGTAANGNSVIAGVRPEHLVIGPPDDGLVAIVENVELLGHERHLVCMVAEQRMTVRQSNGSPAPSVGEKVGLRSVPGEVHLFDGVSMERLD